MAVARDVVDAVNDRDQSVAHVLRLCLQLPQGSLTPDFVTWIHKELDGYDDGEAVPAYREFPTSSRGVSSNGAWRHTDVALDTLLLPDEIQLWVDRPVEIRDGAAAIEDLVELASKSGNTGNLGIDWPGSGIALLNHAIQQGRTNINQTYHFESIHKVIPRARLVEILDRIRTKIAIQLAPLVESESAGLKPVEPTGMASVITVSGSNNQIVSNSPAAAPVQFNFAAGDVEGLVAALADLGASEDSLSELVAIVESDGDEPSRLMNALQWARSQALDVPGHLVAGGVATLILHHFGLA
jgi:hypothetical protein